MDRGNSPVNRGELDTAIARGILIFSMTMAIDEPTSREKRYIRDRPKVGEETGNVRAIFYY